MSQLTLTTTAQRPLRPLVETALNNELRMPEAAIQRTERKIRGYELPTYPHHKHAGSEQKVVPSNAPSLAEVLDEIMLLIELR